MDWIYLPQDRVWWWSPLITVMNILKKFFLPLRIFVNRQKYDILFSLWKLESAAGKHPSQFSLLDMTVVRKMNVQTNQEKLQLLEQVKRAEEVAIDCSSYYNQYSPCQCMLHFGPATTEESKIKCLGSAVWKGKSIQVIGRGSVDWIYMPQDRSTCYYLKIFVNR